MKRRILIETLTNTAIGYIIAVALTYWVLPLFDLHPTRGQSFAVAAIFTVAAVVRGYYVRLWFHRRYLNDEGRHTDSSTDDH